MTSDVSPGAEPEEPNGLIRPVEMRTLGLLDATGIGVGAIVVGGILALAGVAGTQGFQAPLEPGSRVCRRRCQDSIG